MIIAVDFDGTIVDHQYPEIGSLVPGAVEWLKAMQEVGAKLILWTIRCDSESSGPVLSDAVAFCRKHGIEFDGINVNPTQHTWSLSPKAYANIYIDDAAFGCPLRANTRSGGRPFVDWDIIGATVLDMLKDQKQHGEQKVEV